MGILKSGGVSAADCRVRLALSACDVHIVGHPDGRAQHVAETYAMLFQCCPLWLGNEALLCTSDERILRH
jgi:hypothetical protein